MKLSQEMRDIYCTSRKPKKHGLCTHCQSMTPSYYKNGMGLIHFPLLLYLWTSLNSILLSRVSVMFSYWAHGQIKVPGVQWVPSNQILNQYILLGTLLLQTFPDPLDFFNGLVLMGEGDQ